MMLFIHSPLVGPSTWVPVAEAAAAQGMPVRLPDLTAVAGSPPPLWEMLVRSAADAVSDVDGRVVVVGHSGAGVFLPAIGQRLEDRLRALVFVDAQVPAPGGEHRTPPDLVELLDERTVEGILLRWWDWWPSDVIEQAIPDAAIRTALTADMPRLPRAFYDEAVPLPDDWSEWPCGFVQLSEGYRAARAEAEQRGWPCRTLDGHHLSLVTEPVMVADAIATILASLP